MKLRFSNRTGTLHQAPDNPYSCQSLKYNYSVFQNQRIFLQEQFSQWTFNILNHISCIRTFKFRDKINIKHVMKYLTSGGNSKYTTVSSQKLYTAEKYIYIYIYIYPFHLELGRQNSYCHHYVTAWHETFAPPCNSRSISFCLYCQEALSAAIQNVISRELAWRNFILPLIDQSSYYVILCRNLST
jgi:hypothetical protein